MHVKKKKEGREEGVAEVVVEIEEERVEEEGVDAFRRNIAIRSFLPLFLPSFRSERAFLKQLWHVEAEREILP